MWRVPTGLRPADVNVLEIFDQLLNFVAQKGLWDMLHPCDRQWMKPHCEEEHFGITVKLY